MRSTALSAEGAPIKSPPFVSAPRPRNPDRPEAMVMRSYMVQTMGEEFGPFPLEFLREKLSKGLSPSTRVIVVEDGRHVADSNVGDELSAQDNPADALSAFRGYLASTELRAKSGSDLSGAQSDLALAHLKLGDALSKPHLKGSRPWTSLSGILALSRGSGSIWGRTLFRSTPSTRRARS